MSRPAYPEELARLVFHFPVGKHHLLDAHVKSIGTSISARARELLLADMNLHGGRLSRLPELPPRQEAENIGVSVSSTAQTEKETA
jgi:hypothetical protein